MVKERDLVTGSQFASRESRVIELQQSEATPMPQLTDEIILAAIAGFQQQRTQIEEHIARLKGMLSGRRTSASLTASGELVHRRRKVSAAARHRMSEAQKSRWAKVRGETTGSPRSKAQAAKPERRLSEAGRRAIIAATKRRWRLQK